MSKKVALLGFGVEGRAAWRYFHERGAEMTILSEDQPTDIPEGVAVEIGPNIFERAMGYDLVVRTPSIHPDRIKTDGKITSATIEFFKHCPAPIVGITGSKGKGTTSSLIHAILQAADIKSHLVGNIGIPALEVLPEIRANDVVVFELSSFQLWDLQQSPHIAVVLMIEPEHLDIHKDFEEYVNAKTNIRRYQKRQDMCYYHPTNRHAQFIAEQSRWHDQAFRYAVNDRGAVYVKDGKFFSGDHEICNTDVLQIPGAHNVENACAAMSAALNFTQDDVAIKEGLSTFAGLPHRLKLVKRVGGVAYYDDSIATTPASAIAAIQAFTEPKVVILGGSDKGAKFDELAVEVSKQNVKAVLLIGQMREKLRQALERAGFTDNIIMDEKPMPEIVRKAQTLAKPGDVVLLSPACASFDMFKNYVDRGDQFTRAVEQLVSNGRVGE